MAACVGVGFYSGGVLGQVTLLGSPVQVTLLVSPVGRPPDNGYFEDTPKPGCLRSFCVELVRAIRWPRVALLMSLSTIDRFNAKGP